MKTFLLRATCFLSNHLGQIISWVQEAREAADQDVKLVQGGDKRFKIARAEETEFREDLELTLPLLSYSSENFRDSEEGFRKQQDHS